jgi:hypothetical protein
MNKGICSQLWGELFRIIICHLSIGKAALRAVGNFAKNAFRAVAASTPCFSFPYGAVNLLCAIDN